MEDYNGFIESKTHSSINHGIDPVFMPDYAFDYQKYVAEFAIKKGRSGIFLDTGNGKTLIELIVATNHVRATNKKVLIICPLAVAFQFVTEAEKFGIDDVGYSKDGKIKTKIVLCNYERLHLFDSSDFDCVILDESSILKNDKGATRQKVTAFLRKVKYRTLATATPSPNDYIELGTSSEALGYMGYVDMLGKFFKNNSDSIDPRHAGAKWYLKSHAEKDFWRWVSSWSISMRKPSDLGFSDQNHILPKLIERDTIVKNSQPIGANGQLLLVNLPKRGFHDIRAEVKATIKERCMSAVEKASDHESTVYWVNLNPEAKIILNEDKDAYEVSGSMNIDKKEERLLAFSKGEIKKLVTKPKITAFGLNWQHCNHTVFFPTYSYEQYYQAIRRFYRFGQEKDVYVDRVMSDGQTRVLESLLIKRDNANRMFENLIKEMNSEYVLENKGFTKKAVLPTWI